MTTITLPAATAGGRSHRKPAKDLPLAMLALDDVTSAVGADVAWETGATGAGVRVALLDSGISPVGPLAGRVDGSGGDAVGHGTHLAGIIAAMAPESTLVDVNVSDADGAPSISRFLEGLRGVADGTVEADVVVIAAEIVADVAQQNAYVNVVRDLTDAGTVVVAAAGNRSRMGAGLDWTAVPAEVIAVGGAELRGGWAVSAWSATGTAMRLPDLVAPGTSVVSVLAPGSAAATDPMAILVDDHQIRGSGTSQAAAVVGGAVALLVDADPSITPAAVRTRLAASARAMPDARPAEQGAGFLDLRGPFTNAEGASGLSSWTGNSWTGNSWTGNSWTGNSWTGNSWTGNSWTGNSWTGNSWTGNSWTGNSWTGNSWT